MVLFVEDDDVFRGLVTRALELHGYDVHQAISSEGAVEAVTRGLRPDIVLLDLNLPGETGWGLLRHGWLADAGAPPVVVVSGTTLRPARLEEFGIAGYLPKPFPLETLLAIVARLIPSGRVAEAR